MFPDKWALTLDDEDLGGLDLLRRVQQAWAPKWWRQETLLLAGSGSSSREAPQQQGTGAGAAAASLRNTMSATLHPGKPVAAAGAHRK